MLKDLESFLNNKEKEKLSKIECYLTLSGYHLYSYNLFKLANNGKKYDYRYVNNNYIIDIRFIVYEKILFVSSSFQELGVSTYINSFSNIDELEEWLLKVV